jgi:hypothetical protein
MLTRHHRQINAINHLAGRSLPKARLKLTISLRKNAARRTQRVVTITQVAHTPKLRVFLTSCRNVVTFRNVAIDVAPRRRETATSSTPSINF